MSTSFIKLLALFVGWFYDAIPQGGSYFRPFTYDEDQGEDEPSGEFEAPVRPEVLNAVPTSVPPSTAPH